MSETAEEVSSAIALVNAVRQSITCSRDPAHINGLVRGLDIALSTLADSRHDLRGGVRQLRERAACLAGNDAYGDGVAFGLELASDLSMTRPDQITSECLARFEICHPHQVLSEITGFSPRQAT